MKMIFEPARLSGTVHAPASKSEAHRRMICAGLTDGETRLDGYMASADMDATRRCLMAIGASFEEAADTLLIRGHAARPGSVPVMDCGESGSTLRFFVPIALSLTGGGTFIMHGQLGRRPMDVYRDLFVPKGVAWRMGEGADGAAALTVRGVMTAGDYVLPGNVSSQFVSGMLFALPLLTGDSTLTVTPPVESAGYIRMTLEALRQSGVQVESTGDYAWRLPGNQRYAARGGHLSGDYTQAAVLLCAGALGNDVTVTGLNRETTQGDRAVLAYLTALGAQVNEDERGITVRGGNLRGATLDMHDCPDIAPMLALTCTAAAGESRLTRCGRLRLKECDRLTATADILTSLGGKVRVDGDDLVVTGAPLAGGNADCRGDHRMVMLASAAATICAGGVTVDGAEEALAKSWPDYLTVYRSLGGKAE